MLSRIHWALRSLPTESALLRIGQMLALGGFLVLGFVGYRQWGTGIEAAQSQDRLADRFSELVTAAPAAIPLVVDTGAHAADDRPVDDTGAPGAGTAEEATGSADGGQAPVPVVVDGGDPVARIEAPAIGMDRYVVAGVTVGDLKRGPGHYPGSAQPGHLGNAAIAGHRTTYGEPFRNLDDLDVGDEILVTDLLGRTFRYLVTDSFIVEPSDTWVIETSDPERAVLTLTTCNPEFSNRERLIVTAELDDERTGPVADRPFRYAGESVEPVEPTNTVAAVGAPSGDLDTEHSPAATDAPAPAPFAPLESFEPTAAVVTFDEGWFDDVDAWPHVLGWLLALLAVSGLWRALRRRELGPVAAAAAVAAPLAVSLYFTFQNVNRLLPSYL